MARGLYIDEPFGVDMKETVYALDITTIDLCLSVFPWAPFRRAKAVVKLHALWDLRGKSNLKAQRRYSLKGFETPLRRIRCKDPKTGKRLIFLTHNFTLPALTITELYRCRWQAEFIHLTSGHY